MNNTIFNQYRIHGLVNGEIPDDDGIENIGASLKLKGIKMTDEHMKMYWKYSTVLTKQHSYFINYVFFIRAKNAAKFLNTGEGYVCQFHARLIKIWN